MNVVTFTLLYQICSILTFTVIYYMIGKTNFSKQNTSDKLTIFDYFFYSFTVQSTVGLPDITADTTLAKLIVTIQQMAVLLTPVVVIDFLMRK
mgnify:CR=1 FL=1|jgi:hypothetical protein